MPGRIKIALVVGTRPEAIKMAPLTLALRRSPSFKTSLLASGQHSDMLTQALGHFGLESDLNLKVMKDRQSLEHIAASVLRGVGDWLESNPQNLLLVHGDTTTTLAAALAGFYKKTPVGHVEAGLRSHTLTAPFPEEANRVLVDRLSALRFAPTPGAAENLRREGLTENVFVTGNTVIDALFWTLERIRPETDICGLAAGTPLILLTAHRRESWGAPLREICAAVQAILGKHPELSFLIPLHKNPAVRETMIGALGGRPQVVFAEPLDYPVFVEAMNRSLFIMSDSGGVQEEAAALKKPLLILRELSERPEAVEAGTGILVGADRRRIEEEAISLLEDVGRRAAFSARDAAIFGDGRASARIVDCLEAYFNENGGFPGR